MESVKRPFLLQNTWSSFHTQAKLIEKGLSKIFFKRSHMVKAQKAHWDLLRVQKGGKNPRGCWALRAPPGPAESCLLQDHSMSEGQRNRGNSSLFHLPIIYMKDHIASQWLSKPLLANEKWHVGRRCNPSLTLEKQEEKCHCPWQQHSTFLWLFTANTLIEKAFGIGLNKQHFLAYCVTNWEAS